MVSEVDFKKGTGIYTKLSTFTASWSQWLSSNKDSEFSTHLRFGVSTQLSCKGVTTVQLPLRHYGGRQRSLLFYLLLVTKKWALDPRDWDLSTMIRMDLLNKNYKLTVNKSSIINVCTNHMIYWMFIAHLHVILPWSLLQLPKPQQRSPAHSFSQVKLEPCA